MCAQKNVFWQFVTFWWSVIIFAIKRRYIWYKIPLHINFIVFKSVIFVINYNLYICDKLILHSSLPYEILIYISLPFNFLCKYNLLDT